jgi:paraquat-inducible protein A
MRASLYQRYPWRHDVVLLLVVNLALLLFSYTMPFMNSERFFFFQQEYSLLKSVGMMVDSGYVFLAGIILIFSVLFPVGKLILLLAVWFIPLHSGERYRTTYWIALAGKWSMLDVFIVAMLVILISARTVTKAEPMAGLYVFTFAILLSMGLTQWIQRFSRRCSESP